MFDYGHSADLELQLWENWFYDVCVGGKYLKRTAQKGNYKEDYMLYKGVWKYFNL